MDECENIIESSIQTLPNFLVGKIIYSYNYQVALAVDIQRKTICHCKVTDGIAYFKKIFYNDIISVELLIEGASITKVTRNGIGRAILGGIIAGPVGAIVGATTGSSRSIGNTATKNVDLHITINDQRNPLVTIDIFRESGTPRPGAGERQIESARQWVALIRVMIEAANAEEDVSTLNGNPALLSESNGSSTSVADELQKLANLRNQDLITVAEFERAKGRVIGF